ncbi:MAG: YhjD/YihY/BrkB family envelope integrity protein [Spirochaetota bacterium]
MTQSGRKKTTGKKSSKKGTHPFQKLIRTLTDEQQLAEMTYGRLSRKLINTIKITIASVRKFMEDDCLTRSTAITYSTLISLIPTLTVVLTFASIFLGVGAQREELFLQITRFLNEHNLQRLNITPILDAISGLLDNAASIGGIGAAVMIFSATAVLRTIEQALDKIWKVTRQRPLVLKIVYYWAALTLGPLLLIAGTTIATQLSAALSPPDYNDAVFRSSRIWVAGSRSTAGTLRSVHTPVHKIDLDTIDFRNQQIYGYDRELNTLSREMEEDIDRMTFSKTVFNDIDITGGTIRIAGEKGILLTSRDSGNTWTLSKLAYFNLKDIYMFSSENGIIAGSSGMIFTTEDGGASWNPYPIPDFAHTLHSIAFSGEYGYITADRGYLIVSSDGGQNWRTVQLDQARVKRYYVPLNDIDIYGSTVLIVGDDGLVLISRNSGMSYEAQNLQLNNYTDVHIDGTDRFYIGSANGKLYSSSDGGRNWKLLLNMSQRINAINTEGTTITVAGSGGMYLQSRDGGSTWEGTSGRNAGYYLLNFFAPFVVIWLLFFLIYVAIPNVRVPLKPAAIGASFTGSVWVAFIFLFVVYIKSFANGTFAIYGALVAFPLFLIMIYASTVIILFGAELAYTLAHPASYRYPVKKSAIHGFASIINGIRILHFVYKKFENGDGPTHTDEIDSRTGIGADQQEMILRRFTEHGLLTESDDMYLPAAASRNVPVSRIIDAVFSFSPQPLPPADDPVWKRLGGKFEELSRAVRTILEGETLYDCMREEYTKNGNKNENGEQRR